MEKWQMYMQIQTMRNQGFSKRQIAERMELDFRTVSKYLSMTGEEFNSHVMSRERKKHLENYEGVVTDWLKRYPNMSAAQVLDWLKEHYQVEASKRSVRRYAGWIRKKYDIPKMNIPLVIEPLHRINCARQTPKLCITAGLIEHSQYNVNMHHILWCKYS